MVIEALIARADNRGDGFHSNGALCSALLQGASNRFSLINRRFLRMMAPDVPEEGAFYWTVLAPEIVSPAR
jgi:hypothetical protein